MNLFAWSHHHCGLDPPLELVRLVSKNRSILFVIADLIRNRSINLQPIAGQARNDG